MNIVRVTIEPKMFTWARNRAGLDIPSLEHKFKHLQMWENGTQKPTFKQLEDFAKAVCVPVGYMYLKDPPQEDTPIPDLRTTGSRPLQTITPDLRETIYACQRRQDWYIEFAKDMNLPMRDFVGSVTTATHPSDAAKIIQDRLKISVEARAKAASWDDAFRECIDHAEYAGILVMINGVVGANTHRPLNVQEFRGFAIPDKYAPLIFINGADAKSAQMFTFAHELAHIWLGSSGISDVSVADFDQNTTELWCNQTAAELLVPAHLLRNAVKGKESLREIQSLTQTFKTSSMVILRRLYDIGSISKSEFTREYTNMLSAAAAKKAKGGGNFIFTQRNRVSKRFVDAVVPDTLDGRTSYKDAFRLLGVHNKDSMIKLAKHEIYT